MRIKKNYFIIPLVVIATAAIGGWFTSNGMSWYDTRLIQPSLTPPKWAFPLAWNTIFILVTISALIIWNIKKNKKQEKLMSVITGLFISNAILNAGWSLLFFQLQGILPAFVEMFFLIATLVLLVYYTWKISKFASLLLLPYLLWISFATYLTYLILMLN